MGSAAVKLLKAMAAAGEEYLAMWPKRDIIRHVVGSVAIAVQRGSAMAYLEGYDRALSVSGRPLASMDEDDSEEQGEDEKQKDDQDEEEEEKQADVGEQTQEDEECNGERMRESYSGAA